MIVVVFVAKYYYIGCIEIFHFMDFMDKKKLLADDWLNIFVGYRRSEIDGYIFIHNIYHGTFYPR